MTSTEPHTPTALTGGTRPTEAGGERFWALFLAMTPRLLLWLRLRVPPPLRGTLETDDLFQETAVRCRFAADRLPQDEGERRAFVFGVARNVLREQLRALGRTGREVAQPMRTSVAAALRDPATSVTQRLLRAEQAALAKAGVDGLEDVDRRLMLYHGVEGARLVDVARVLGLDYEAARKRWQRLRSRLRACLG